MKRPGTVAEDREPGYAGWQPLAKVLNTTDPFFDQFMFLQGYEFSSNIYLMVGDSLTIVDPGNDYTAFIELFRLGFQPAAIKKIILTHGHRDHAMGAFELLRSYPSIAQTGGFELVLHEASPRELKEIVTQLGSRVIQVRGGENLELNGQQWQIIYTPGHTIDGICLYHPATKTAFTGDTVLPHAMAEPDMYAGGRLDQYLLGVKALLAKGVENILPGHGIPVASSGTQVVEETYESLIMRTLGVETPIPWMAGATELAQRGLLEEALFCCNKALAGDPTNLQALELKASCLNDLGRYQEALEVLDHTLEQKQDSVFSLTSKGFALMGLGRYAESLEWFDAALKIDPNMHEALIYKGVALCLSGHYDEAMNIQAFKTEFAGAIGQEIMGRLASLPPRVG